MRIDAHQHFWQFDPVRDAWIDGSMKVLQRDFLPEDLLPHIQDHNFSGSIAVQADQSENETLFLLEHARMNDTIKGVVGWVDLRAVDIEERLAAYEGKEKLCGFRHIAQSEPDNRFLLRDDFVKGLRCLRQFDFSYDILIYPSQLPAAIELVNLLPDQKFVLDHIAKPLIKDHILEPWTSQIRELGSSKNVYCKISGIITEADHRNWSAEEIWPYLDIVFEAFSTERIMFGSDWPVCLLAGSYGQVVGLIEDYVESFSNEEREKIFGKNAAEFYGINTKQ